MTLSEYLTPRLWQAIGAETSALWRADRTGLERASTNFNATLRDYARLGAVLANEIWLFAGEKRLFLLMGVRTDDFCRPAICLMLAATLLYSLCAPWTEVL